MIGHEPNESDAASQPYPGLGGQGQTNGEVFSPIISVLNGDASRLKRLRVYQGECGGKRHYQVRALIGCQKRLTTAGHGGRYNQEGVH